jgi:prevent-host-death family protein
MPKVIPQRSLRNDNAKIIDEVVNGQSFVVTRNGVEVAEIRPIRHKKSVVVHRDVLLALVGVGPQIDGRAFRQDLDDAMDQYL